MLCVLFWNVVADETDQKGQADEESGNDERNRFWVDNADDRSDDNADDDCDECDSFPYCPVHVQLQHILCERNQINI